MILPFREAVIVNKYLFDLDGTIIDTELLPLLGRELGVSDQLTELTRLTMQGVIPFESSFRQRVDMLSEIPISRVRDIVRAAPVNVAIADFITRNSKQVVIVTGNCDVWVSEIAERFGVEMECSHATQNGDRLGVLTKILDKGEVGQKYGQNAVAIGDGHNDLPMFRHCRYSVAYGGVHAPAPSLMDVATHAVYHSGSLCRLLPQL